MPEPTHYKSGRPIPYDNPFELFAWVFMRISGIVLLFMAIGHLVIMHLINSIDTINYQFVVQRWATPFWRIYDGIMLFLALLHGFNGLRTILDDYLRPGMWKKWCTFLLYAFSLILLVGGAWVIITFKPK